MFSLTVAKVYSRYGGFWARISNTEGTGGRGRQTNGSPEHHSWHTTSPDWTYRATRHNGSGGETESAPQTPDSSPTIENTQKNKQKKDSIRTSVKDFVQMLHILQCAVWGCWRVCVLRCLSDGLFTSRDRREKILCPTWSRRVFTLPRRRWRGWEGLGLVSLILGRLVKVLHQIWKTGRICG